MSTAPDPGRRLLHALIGDATGHGVALTLIDHAERPWASATFTGSRHRLRLGLSGERAATWLAAVVEADLLVRGCLVADIHVDRTDDGADLTILLLDPA